MEGTVKGRRGEEREVIQCYEEEERDRQEGEEGTVEGRRGVERVVIQF